MRLIVGLGNPGSQYHGTRHNVGYDVVSELCRRWQVGKAQFKFQAEYWDGFWADQKVLLAKPMTYMNKSGESVQQMSRFFQIPPEEVAVICDDMNLAVGQLRWRASGSAGGQNGLDDIVQRMGTQQIPRLRIGIGRPQGKMDASDWVLGRFRPEDKVLIELAEMQAADSVELFISDGISAAMNKFNRTTEA